MVRLARNFEANLDAIREFLGDGPRFEQLLDQLFGTILPNLDRHPELGFDLLSRRSGSVEGLARAEALRARVGDGALREYISGEDLVLYVVVGGDVTLLAIKHHRQLSFDLRAFWGP